MALGNFCIFADFKERRVSAAAERTVSLQTKRVGRQNAGARSFSHLKMNVVLFAGVDDA